MGEEHEMVILMVGLVEDKSPKVKVGNVEGGAVRTLIEWGRLVGA